MAPAVISQGRSAKVIVVTSPNGGTGKSTVSLNLAAYLGLRLKATGKRVCLVDANFQQADAGKMLNQYSPNITGIVKDIASLAPNSIERYLVSRPELNLSVLLGPPSIMEANPALLNPRLFNSIFSALKPNFDYIIVDTPVAELFHDHFRSFLLPAADYIIVTVVPSVHRLVNVDAWLSEITQPRHTGGDDIDPNIIGIVLNQEETGVSIDAQTVQHELSMWNLIGVIPRSTAWINAANNYELVATKNYHALNDAFSRILYYATREEVLLLGIGQEENHKKSRTGFLQRLFRRGS